MLDAGTDVMKTFSDYSENTEMQFSQVKIGPGSAWEGKRVMNLGLPRNMLIALVVRGQERIVARGDTLLQAGDEIPLRGISCPPGGSGQSITAQRPMAVWTISV